MRDLINTLNTITFNFLKIHTTYEYFACRFLSCVGFYFIFLGFFFYLHHVNTNVDILQKLTFHQPKAEPITFWCKFRLGDGIFRGTGILPYFPDKKQKQTRIYGGRIFTSLSLLVQTQIIIRI